MMVFYRPLHPLSLRCPVYTTKQLTSCQLPLHRNRICQWNPLWNPSWNPTYLILSQRHASTRISLVRRLRRFLQKAFGSTCIDDTPRGIQERKDSYWILLAMEHRRLRVIDTKSSHSDSSNEEARLAQAAATLDSANIGDLKLWNLRREVQRQLQPQIRNLLLLASRAEDEFQSRRSLTRSHAEEKNGEEQVEEGDHYDFSEEESKEYADILRREYEYVSQWLEQRETSIRNAEFPTTQEPIRNSDPFHFYKKKKSAIETVLHYYNWWWPEAIPTNYSRTTNENDEDEFGFCSTNADPELTSAMRHYHVKHLIRSYFIRHLHDNDSVVLKQFQQQNQQQHIQHSILPLKSTIPNAGRGVFIDGFAPAGTLLAFFPGKVWPKEHLLNASLQTQLEFTQNDPRHQLSMRYDDILIDSRTSPYTVVKNLWALGHIVNHPPAFHTLSPELQQNDGARTIPPEKQDSNHFSYNYNRDYGPNCMTVLLDFDKSNVDHVEQYPQWNIRQYIPNEYEVPPKPWMKSSLEEENIIMHGMGLISLRDVSNEELFYDYRLSPSTSKNGKTAIYPTWYHIWDKDASNNRWHSDN